MDVALSKKVEYMYKGKIIIQLVEKVIIYLFFMDTSIECMNVVFVAEVRLHENE